MADDPLPIRMLPELTAENHFFWTSGADGLLRVLKCEDCGFFNHPPYPRCGRCLSTRVAPTPVSGHGSVYSFTINCQQWVPDLPRYVVALVELDEQPGLRLFTNIIGCDPDDVAIGDRVTVDFVPAGEIWLPLFRRSE